jgi:hypothetical protein
VKIPTCLWLPSLCLFPSSPAKSGALWRDGDGSSVHHPRCSSPTRQRQLRFASLSPIGCLGLDRVRDPQAVKISFPQSGAASFGIGEVHSLSLLLPPSFVTAHSRHLTDASSIQTDGKRPNRPGPIGRHPLPGHGIFSVHPCQRRRLHNEHGICRTTIPRQCSPIVKAYPECYPCKQPRHVGGRPRVSESPRSSPLTVLA